MLNKTWSGALFACRCPTSYSFSLFCPCATFNSGLTLQTLSCQAAENCPGAPDGQLEPDFCDLSFCLFSFSFFFSYLKSRNGKHFCGYIVILPPVCILHLFIVIDNILDRFWAITGPGNENNIKPILHHCRSRSLWHLHQLQTLKTEWYGWKLWKHLIGGPWVGLLCQDQFPDWTWNSCWFVHEIAEFPHLQTICSFTVHLLVCSCRQSGDGVSFICSCFFYLDVSSSLAMCWALSAIACDVNLNTKRKREYCEAEWAQYFLIISDQR